ncbi:hypothetical protein ACFLXL_03215 [Chloroflexota bacterium]
MLKNKRFTQFLLLVALSIMLFLTASCTSQAKPSIPPLPQESVQLTYTISDDVAMQLMYKLVGIIGIRFILGNKALIGYGGFDYTISIEAINGELCLTGFEPVLNRYGPRFTKYMKQYDSDGKVHLLDLWFDPRKELNLEIDKLPFIESVTTREGEATFIYRLP